VARQASGTISLPKATIHLLSEVRERVSSTQVRAAAHKSVKHLSRYLPRLVSEYVKKEHLYVNGPAVADRSGTLRGKMLSFHRSGKNA
jgi:nicotinic acid mononucleotide adenylyltransferase